MPENVKIVLNSIRRCFYRGEHAEFEFTLLNFFPYNLPGCRLEVSVGELWSDAYDIPVLSINAVNIKFRFDTAILKSGEYVLKCRLLQQDKTVAGAGFSITVATARKRGCMELWHWPATVHYNALEADDESARLEIDKLAAMGYTWAQLRASWAVVNPGKATDLIEYAMARGIDMGILIENGNGGCFRADRDVPPEARLIDSSGKVTEFVFPHHPMVLNKHRILLERIMLLFRELPSCTTVFVNSEVEDKLKLPCNPEALKMHEAALGFSPLEKLKSTERVFASPYPDAPFVSPGVIADDDPEYLYAKYFFKHGDGFVITNGTMAEVIHRYRPDVKVITDPLRLCSVYGRFDGADIVSSWTYTNPDPKATLFIETLLAEARPDNKDVIHTITLWNYAGSLIPSGKDRFARDKTLRMEPDRLLENAWINFARGPKGIGTYFGSPMELFFENGDPFIYSPETEKAIGDFALNVMAPFGEMVRKTAAVPRRAAVLDSFASRVYGVCPRPYNHYPIYYIYNFYTVLNMAHIPADVLFDETIVEKGLDSYDLLVLPNCDTLPESVYKEILKFVRKGGIVVADQYLRADIPGVIRFDFDFTYRSRVNANANARGMDFAVKDDTAFRQDSDEKQLEGVTAEADQQALETYAAKVRETLDGKIVRDVDCSSPRLLLNMREYSGIKYLFVVNDHRTYGERVGKYKSMLEKGLPENAEFTVRDPGFEPVIYELTTHCRLECRKNAEGNYNFELNVPAAGGCIVAFYPAALGPAGIEVPPCITRGTRSVINVSLGNAAGLQPLKIAMTDSKGCRSEFSGYYLAENGSCSMEFIPAANEPSGKWSVETIDLTSGDKCRKDINIA
ncbi:MAG: hypothetical protein WCV67_01740 [Victivallaceae bacterium]|jgi:hypothetical protein